MTGSEEPAADAAVGELEIVHLITGAMPTGVTVSRAGRIFVNFPKWGDAVEFTVAEIKDGALHPYPSQAANNPDGNADADALVSVQSVVVDPRDRLWILDTGSPMFQPTQRGGPKLVCVDLERDEICRTIVFDPDVALPTTYLNDVRFDLPDTMSVAADGHLYVTADQLYRQSRYRRGVDERRQPYALFRTPIGAGPVALAR